MDPNIDVSPVKRVYITVVTKHPERIPPWAVKTSPPIYEQTARTDCTMNELARVDTAELFQFLEAEFAVECAVYQLNDKTIDGDGKKHRIRFTLVRKEHGLYPLDSLKIFFEHTLFHVRLRADKQGAWISLFCLGRMQKAKPRTILRMRNTILYSETVPRPEPIPTT